MTFDSHLPSALQKLAWAFALTFGLFSAWGQLSIGWNAVSVLLATLWVLFQVATNLFAVAARHLFRRKHPVTGVGAIAMMIVTGLFSHEALTNAFLQAQSLGLAENMDADMVGALFIVAPFLEVMSSRASDLLRVQDEPPPPEGEQRITTMGAAIATGLVVGGLGAGQAREPAPVAQHPLPSESVTNSTQPQTAFDAPPALKPHHAPSPTAKSAGRGRMSAGARNNLSRDRSRQGLAARQQRAVELKTAHPEWTQLEIGDAMGEPRQNIQRWLQVAGAVGASV